MSVLDFQLPLIRLEIRSWVCMVCSDEFLSAVPVKEGAECPVVVECGCRAFAAVRQFTHPAAVVTGRGWDAAIDAAQAVVQKWRDS